MEDLEREQMAREVHLAHDQRWRQAGWVALGEVGPEPAENTCAWFDWVLKWTRATDEAFQRLN